MPTPPCSSPGWSGTSRTTRCVDEGGRYVLPYPGFDACAETEFGSIDIMDAGFASPEYRETVQADELDLIDKPSFFCALTEREVLMERDGGARDDGVKLITLIRHNPISSPDALVDALRGPYAAAVEAADGPRRHELLVTLPDAHEGRYPIPCDAIDELWFDSPETAVDFATGDAGVSAWIHLAGLALGTERLVARPNRVR